MRLPPSTHAFRAMGTDVELVANGGIDPRALRRAARSVELVFAREEQRFSRFRPDTELTRVNARAGRWTRVSAGFSTLLGFALEAASHTGGLFDPTGCGRWPEIELDGDLVRLPPGVDLDFGDVARTWTVDLAAQRAVSVAALPWAVVVAGGDLRIAGHPPAAGIEVGIGDPQNIGHETTRVTLASGALATSSAATPSAGRARRDPIPPRIGLTADTGVRQATAWAETCAEAEIRFEQALLEGLPALQRLSAVMVMDDGRIVMNLETMERRELVAVGA